MAYRTIAQITYEAGQQGRPSGIAGWRTKSEIRKTLSTLIKLLRKYNHTFLFGEPPLLFYRGGRKWLDGDRDSAIKDWQASAQSAKRLAMPWDEANALREIGKRPGADKSRAYLSEALRLFEASGATYDAIETKKLMRN
jgi:hypothetical protein